MNSVVAGLKLMAALVILRSSIFIAVVGYQFVRMSGFRLTSPS